MTARREFRRIVFGLHQSAIDRSALNLGAELAAMLRLEMMGLFIEEPSVAELAGLPFVREFRTLGRQWHPIEVERLAREFELSAMAARRLLTEAAMARQITCRFEVVRAGAETAITSISRATDIVIIPEPKSAVERIIEPFPRLSAAAFRSEASVLLVPSRIARTRGPVLAIAFQPDDPSVAAAVAIAAAANEELVILEAYDESAPQSAIAEEAAAGVGVKRLRVASGRAADPRLLLTALEPFDERMIVLSRGAFGRADESVPTLFASSRQVPVLVVEPAR